MLDETTPLPGYVDLASRLLDAELVVVSDFVVACARLLSAYDEADLQSVARLEAFAALADHVLPVHIPGQIEPVEIIGEIIGLLERDLGPRFADVVGSALDDATRSWRVFRTLLGLLAAADVTIGESLAFRALDSGEWLARENVSMLKDAAVQFVELAGTRTGIGALSMTSRLRRVDALSHEAIEAALRSVASWDPSRLSSSLRAHARDLSAVSNPDDPVELRPVFRDLAQRIGPAAFVTVLSEFGLKDYPVFWQAAFGGGASAPLKLMKVSSALRANQQIYIDVAGERVEISCLGPLASDENGILLIKLLTKAQFWMALDVSDEERQFAAPKWFLSPDEMGLGAPSVDPQEPEATTTTIAVAKSDFRNLSLTERILHTLNWPLQGALG